MNSPDRRRMRATIAYHGAAFRGSATNAGVRTVLGDLQDAASVILREPIEFAQAGRTDAGVHAWGQVITADLDAAVDLENLALRLNRMCGPDIAIRAIEWAATDFDARFSATSRSYRYDIWNTAWPHPLRSDISWHVPRPLDLAAMRRATEHLIGEHDFASFCRRPKPRAGQHPPSLVRVMYEMSWQRIDDSPLLRYQVRGSAFCQQQVRAMVGTLTDVGLGRIEPDRLPEILAAKDRNAAGQVAPPHGLVLWEVGYDGVRWDHQQHSG